MDTVTSAEPRRPHFGSLPKDISVREKRARVKFFDSAEWAMKEENHDPDRTIDNRGKPAHLPIPTVDEIQKHVELTKCFERSPLEV